MVFQVASEKYGIESIFINKVFVLNDLTPLPGMSRYMIGIINIRGQIIPVINLKYIFEISEKERSVPKVIVLKVDDATFGICADNIYGLESIAQSDIQETLPTLSGIRKAYLQGISNSQITILDPNKIVADKKLFMNDINY